MTVWRLIYTDLKAGTVLGELPSQTFGFTETLNSDGSFEITMPLVTTTPTGRVTNDVSALQITDADLAPGETAVYFERDGAVLWGGIVWGVTADVLSNTMTVQGAGFLSYFRRRYIRTTTTHTAADQLNIARAFIDNAQAVSNGSIGILTTDTNTSGRTRNRTYLGFERKNVAEALTQLANVLDGFDFRFHSFRNSSGIIVVEFRVSYPATGRRTETVFELGTNVQILNYTSDGSALTNSVDVIGAGDGDDLKIRTASNPASLAFRPLLESVASFSDVSVDATLDEHAGRIVTRGSNPIETLSLVIYPDAIPNLGSYVIGDQIKIMGDYGYLSMSNFWRIVSLAVTVSPDGAEEVHIDLVPIGVFE